jgi:ABC-2 type transport system ATP-binding protein
VRVELTAVGKRYGRVPALRDIDLVLESGSRTALVGPNGSGKSTLTRILMGMLTHDGEVRLGGCVATMERAALAQRIAYVPQIAPRLAAPVRDLVDAVARLRGIERQRIAGFAGAFELDLAALATRPFRALSGGMRQKLLASMALAVDADLLLLDEPTASMDAGSRATFFRLLDQQARTATVLLSSHRLDEIRRLVAHVVVLEEGRVAYDGPAPDYLAAHAESVIEIAASGEQAARFLRGLGFVAGNGDWWSCSVPVNQRAQLLRVIVRELNGKVTDVMARDVERLDPDDKCGQP